MKIAAGVTALVGVLVLAVGLFLGYSSVRQDGISCGSALGPTNTAALEADYARAIEADAVGASLTDLSSVQHHCEDARATRSTLTWALLIPGIALAVVSLGLGLAYYNRKQPPAVPA